jgi:hypothetical protein
MIYLFKIHVFWTPNSNSWRGIAIKPKISISRGQCFVDFKTAKFYLKENVFIRLWNQFQDTVLNGATVPSTPGVREVTRKTWLLLVAWSLYQASWNFVNIRIIRWEEAWWYHKPLQACFLSWKVKRKLTHPGGLHLSLYILNFGLFDDLQGIGVKFMPLAYSPVSNNLRPTIGNNNIPSGSAIMWGGSHTNTI